MGLRSNKLYFSPSSVNSGHDVVADARSTMIRDVALLLLVASTMLFVTRLVMPGLIDLTHKMWRLVLIEALACVLSLMLWSRRRMHQAGLMLVGGTMLAITSNPADLSTTLGYSYTVPILLSGGLLGMRLTWGIYSLTVVIMAVLARFYGWNEVTLNSILINFLVTAIVTRVTYKADEQKQLLRERYLHQKELQDREQALRHAKEIMTILYSVRHDVKNPLATAERLLSYADAQNVDEIAGAVRETLRRTLLMLDSTFYEVENPYPTTLSLVKLHPTITMIRTRYRQFLDFVVDSSIDDGLAAPADLLLLERILDNVARNSARFAHQLHISWDGEGLLLHDDGPGFSEQALWALQSGLRPQSDAGWGLGLLGIKVTAEKHGIQIAPFNHPAGGAAIKVVFPHPARQN